MHSPVKQLPVSHQDLLNPPSRSHERLDTITPHPLPILLLVSCLVLRFQISFPISSLIVVFPFLFSSLDSFRRVDTHRMIRIAHDSYVRIETQVERQVRASLPLICTDQTPAQRDEAASISVIEYSSIQSRIQSTRNPRQQTIASHRRTDQEHTRARKRKKNKQAQKQNSQHPRASVQ
jgi:hypothetical protein